MKSQSSLNYNLLLLILFFFSENCMQFPIGPEYINGAEANQRITPPVLAKIQSCGLLNHSYNKNDTNTDPWRRTLSTETSNAFFLTIYLFARFEAFDIYSYYKTQDIDRCSKDIQFFSCDQLSNRWINDANFGFFIGSLVCLDVKKYESPAGRIFRPEGDREEKEE